MTANVCDIIIIGTGPAGITAAMYGARLGLNTVVFGDIPGGSTYMIEKMDNYPGFPEGISGPQFGVFSFQQAQQQGALFTMTRLKKLLKRNNRFVGIDSNEQEFIAPSAIVATGRIPKRLSIPNASLKGIHFCSLCDGPLYRGKNATLAVIGDDNTAAQHTLTLSRIADKVMLISKNKQFAMDQAHRKRLKMQTNIEMFPQTEVIAYEGNEHINGLTLQTKKNTKQRVAIAGAFLVIGWRPNTKMLDLEVDTTESGYLKTDNKLMTSCAGLFTAGDVRDTDIWQVLTSCADGARTAKYAAEFLENMDDLY